MATKKICITEISKKTGLSEEEVAALADETMEAVNAGETRETFLRRKQNADKQAIQDRVFNLSKQDAIDRDITRRMEQGSKNEYDALLESLEGGERGGEGAKVNLDTDREAIKNTLLSRLFSGLTNEDPNWQRTLRTLSDEDNVHLRMELEDGLGSSGNKRMEKIARPIRRALDAVHIRAQKAGLVVKYLKNYLPHNWDADRIRAFGKENYVKSMKSYLDLRETFPGLNSNQIDEVLGKTWDSLALGRDIDLETAGTGEFKMSSKHARNRLFKFKDASSSQAAINLFGRKDGTVLTGVMNYIDKMANDISVVERLGTTPRENLRLAAMKAYNRSADPAVRQKLQAFISDPAHTSLGKALDYGLRVADIPVDLRGAHINRSIRAAMNMSKLGKAMLASIVDLATAAHNLRFQGMGMFESYSKLFKMIGEVATNPAEARQFNHHLAVGMEGVLSSFHKWTIGDNLIRPSVGMHSLLSRAENFFFRASGLNYWTDTIRSAATRVTAEHLGSNAHLPWGRLDKKVQRLLGLYDIDGKTWEQLRKGVTTEADGRQYILPENLRDGGLDETIMRLYQGEADYAVLMPNAKTRRLLLQGHRPGTIIGEALRYMMQFKSFPAAISQKLLGRGFYQDRAGLPLLVAQMWAFGYVAMTAKDAAMGKKPKSLKKVKTYTEAFIHGGALGIYGDLLLGSMVHRRGNPLEAIAGPAASEFLKLSQTLYGAPKQIAKGRSERTLARLGNQVLSNVPYANHFMMQGLFHYAVLNHLIEMQNPGSLKRRMRKMEKEYDQGYFMFSP